MSKPVTFKLEDEATGLQVGTVTFNGKFVFELDDKISREQWETNGFIPLPPNSNRVESDDLFYYLKSRLPINLREENAEDKLTYIKKQGLRVASDSFVLKSIK